MNLTLKHPLTAKLGLSLFLLYLLFSRSAVKQAEAAPVATDCSLPLDTEDGEYFLSGNVVGNCVITANNVTIDGLDLYEINGDVLATNASTTQDSFDIVLQNVLVTGDVNSVGATSLLLSRGGDIDITNSEVQGDILAMGGTTSYYGFVNYSDGGVVTITDSEVANINTSGGTNLNSGYGYYGGRGGNVTITDSDAGNITANGIASYFGTRGGAIDVSDSTVGDIENVGGDGDVSGYYGGKGGDVTITNSVSGTILNRGGDGVTAGDGGDITITDESFTGDINGFGGDSLGVADSFGAGGSGGALVITDSEAGNINISGGYIDNGYGHGGDATITRSTVGTVTSNGGDAYDGGGNGGDMIITDSTVGTVSSLGGDGYGSDGNPGVLTLTDNVPTITAPDTTIAFSDTFSPLSGVTATDLKDGNLIASTTASGTVAVAAGIYPIEYEVTDLGTSFLFNSVATSTGPNTTTLTRLVTREAQVSSGGGGGGSSTSIKRRVDVLTREGEVERAEDIKEAHPRFFDNVTVTPTLTSFINQNRAIFITALDLGIELPEFILTIIGTKPAFSLPTRDLDLDMEGLDVAQLQNYLINKGYSIPAGSTGYFGTQTQSALARFQADHNITPAAGYYGPKTRAYLQVN